MVDSVIKRDGRIVPFEPERIRNAIKKAMLATKFYDEKLLDKIYKYVLKLINEKFKEKIPHVEEIQDLVEFSLIKYDLYEVAKAYILYRKEREKIREQKKLILKKDILDEVDKSFSLNAIRLLANRYLMKNEKGEFIEGPKQLFQRVAALVVIPDILYDSKVYDKEGKQKIWESEPFDFEKWENKLGLGEFKWNRWHLERMKHLWEELNKFGKMKVPWKKFFEMLKNGEFNNYYENVKKYYNLMVEKKFLPNSPTLFNAGNSLGQLSACFVLDIEDSMESIMETAKEMAIIFKSGGGVGINYSKLRPEGDIVRSTGGVASGPVSFMRIIDTITEVVKQGGKRRGANMGILEIWHPDIRKFIHSKEEEGILTNFNISVMIDEKFWECYKKDEKYPLINPRNGEKVGYLNPKQIFEEIAFTAWKTADPGVLFMDNINRRNVLKKEKGLIRSTNPCVTGDTFVLTDSGWIKAKDLKIGQKVWTPFGWLEIEEFYDNGIQDIYEVELENGMKIKVTEDHKFFSLDGWKKVSELKEGDKIRIVLENPEEYPNSNPAFSEEFAEFLGYWVGDGSLSVSDHVSLYLGVDESLIPFYQSVVESIAGYSSVYNREGQYVVDVHRKEFANTLREITGLKISDSKIKTIPQIIFTQPKNIQAAFLRGLFTADGSVYNANGTIIISLSSSSKKLLEETQILLLGFGIYSHLTKEKKKEKKLIKGGVYTSQGTYRLLISGRFTYKFALEIGLRGKKEEKLLNLINNLKKGFYNIDKTFLKIKRIEYVGKERVFDIKASPLYTWTTNGFYSYDCGEEPLYPYESCNLGSINLYAFVKEGKFDWDEFVDTIKWAYRFLDNVIDVNKYPLEKIDVASKLTRRIGLGYMGLADALFALKIPYNSEEGFEFIRRVSEYLTYYSMFESVKRAKERGAFPLYEKSSYPDELPVEGYYHKELWTLDWELLKKELKKYGIRNVEVTTIAPTGSISMIFDVSSGIEPQFALVYEKRVVAGEFFYLDQEFEKQLKERGLFDKEILKKISENGGSVQGIKEVPEDMRRVFVTSLDIPWWDHIRAQAVAQLWITTSISKTINMPEWVSPEDVMKAYLFAHESGCKGITIYREGSKSKQVIYLPAEVSKGRYLETMKLIKNKTLEIMKKFGIDVSNLINGNNNGKLYLDIKIKEKKEEDKNKIEKCPVCGSKNLIHQGGCVTCLDCGWSACVIA